MSMILLGDCVEHLRGFPADLASKVLVGSPYRSDSLFCTRRRGMIEGNCIRIMPTLFEKTFDLVVTSPPYDAGKSYEGKRDLKAYTEFAKEWIDCVPRLLKPTGSFWINLGYTKLDRNQTLPLTYLYYPLIAATGLKLVQEIVWEYPSGMAYRNRFSHRSERWQWWAVDPNVMKFRLDDVRVPPNTPDRRNNPLGKNPADVWRFTQVMNHSKVKGNHPCPFPEPMIERIVRACTDECDAILDPFAGSGTVGRVARRLHRNATMIDVRSYDVAA